MHVFQGEFDSQTLFEHALEIRNSGEEIGTQLVSFNQTRYIYTELRLALILAARDFLTSFS
ncbi:MAG: hypothetical protein K0R14_1281 [Burkholderiales bacterium]|jgi:hypothetical protein|nr:hypothetical protein [Burkholderiales bacterium]